MEEDLFIDFDCPKCRTPVSYLNHFGGTAQPCPNCGAPVVVPRQQGEPGRPVPIPFQTPRLVIRRLGPRDWRDLLEYHADDDLFRYTPRQAQGEEEILQWLDQDQRVSLTQSQQTLFLGLQLRQPEKLIGEIAFRFTDTDRLQASLAVYINRHFQRQGYGLEALCGVLVFCFRDIGLHRVTATCDTRNAPALGLLAKSGFRQEGQFLKSQIVKDEWIDAAWFAMLEEEYQARLKGA